MPNFQDKSEIGKFIDECVEHSYFERYLIEEKFRDLKTGNIHKEGLDKILKMMGIPFTKDYPPEVI